MFAPYLNTTRRSIRVSKSATEKKTAIFRRHPTARWHLATGSFIALLDHDDVLPEHALYMVAATLTADPEDRLDL